MDAKQLMEVTEKVTGAAEVIKAVRNNIYRTKTKTIKLNREQNQFLSMEPILLKIFKSKLRKLRICPKIAFIRENNDKM